MKGKDVLIGTGKVALFAVVVAIVAYVINVVFDFIDFSGQLGLWDNASPDAKLLFAGIIMAGIIANKWD